MMFVVTYWFSYGGKKELNIRSDSGHNAITKGRDLLSPKEARSISGARAIAIDEAKGT